ncbi:MAG: PAS domain S-box protein [Gallionella sp.]
MTDSSGNFHPKQILNYVAITVAVVLLGCASLLITRSWEEGKLDQVARLESMVEMSAVAMDSYFTQLNLAMQTLGADIAQTPGKIELERAYTLVSRFQHLHRELGNVVLMRDDGQILLTGKTPNRPDLLTLGGDPAFLKFRDELLQGSPFAVGQPVMGHIDTNWVVAARYAVTDQAGKLRFIISANLPDDFLRGYLPYSAKPGVAALGLIRNDGYLVSRFPEIDVATRDHLYGKPAAGAMTSYLRAANEPVSGHMELPGNDGKESLLRVMRRLDRFPLSVYVDVPASEIDAAGWKRVKLSYLLLTLLLATIFVTYGISHSHRKKWSVAQRREVLRRDYEQSLHERSPNEIFMFDAKTLRFSYANDAALESTGYSLKELQQKTIMVLHPELSVESFGRMIEPVRRGELDSVDYQTNQARANGNTYPVDVHLQLIRVNDGEEGFLAIINDITARRIAEINISQFNAPVERRSSARK